MSKNYLFIYIFIFVVILSGIIMIVAGILHLKSINDGMIFCRDNNMFYQTFEEITLKHNLVTCFQIIDNQKVESVFVVER